MWFADPYPGPGDRLIWWVLGIAIAAEIAWALLT